PRLTTVLEGAHICREHHLQLVLAVGGGSCIDCAKAIAFAACHDGDPWDFWLGKTEVTAALPVGAILTVAATGSEMNWTSVITNETTEDKRGKGHPLLIPKFAFLDPTFTYSVNPYQTAAGVVDIMAHVFEFYFSPVTTAFLQDSFAEAILKTCIRYGPIALRKPENYEARANLMWASSMALNGVASRGKTFDGFLHGVEHVISGLYDLTHGVGLAILMTPWLEAVLNETTLPKMVQFARNVWNVTGHDDWEIAHQGIAKHRDFLLSLGIPLTFTAIGIGSERFNEIIERAIPQETRGVFKPISKQELFLDILTKAL
ncbi:MAG TPA: iron-containing alcohol dehydrogenase, partial [Bacillota bacterium]|nr:iron-containing alcohol dehydrogenase [Bacillota bacterium]